MKGGLGNALQSALEGARSWNTPDWRNSGLKVSRIALGCMSFGDTSRGFSQWSLGDEESRPFFEQAVELGITRGIPPTSTVAAARRRSSAVR
jgi:hypothetical protein